MKFLPTHNHGGTNVFEAGTTAFYPQRSESNFQTSKQNMTMKKLFLLVFFATGIVVSANAQLKVGNNPTTIDPSAVLEVESTNKGFLPPRVALASLTDVTTIPSPATGLLVYNNGTGTLSTPGYYYWNGTSWAAIGSTSGQATGNFRIGETRSTVISVSVPSFGIASTGVSRTWMNGRAVTNTQSVSYKLLSDAAGSTANFITFDGLRMDFASAGYAGPAFPAPKLVNTTTSPILISLNSLSTANPGTTYAGTWIAPGAVCWSVDGNDGFSLSQNNVSEYVSANILVHDTATGGTKFYIATWSLMWVSDGFGHDNIYGLFTITRHN